MIKKVAIGFGFSVLLTIAFWQVTARLSLGHDLDNVAFLASPFLAIVISVVLVRSRLMNNSRAGDGTGQV
ncbi:hypothetical protein [Mesorhizobium sp.]|uniref:hypothetical protein n=1 Tax=Mesorhizobium sp. TaxID=1871066 RepID=UPI000FE38982|nr:hypothetical protein [Mesorhizobium sp.]RWH74734.1 MAG: hypothetical protein EOQ84_06170 [Mesorhizobium sp.]RWL29443.1 MAG: hypothetical protein EOR58_10165 [Mesorhizobium sp.]RWL35158.1 MAG: hypothetical protein EOR63_06990 [Mesorhizobium sp.]RWL38798.1 MAG: hypothetical protein EOR59_11115 [Mesorhizobium sp.]RWL54799.1 MAG: hypothetical protein EOR62_10940 [Mesorhizobium sp.]